MFGFYDKILISKNFRCDIGLRFRKSLILKTATTSVSHFCKECSIKVMITILNCIKTLQFVLTFLCSTYDFLINFCKIWVWNLTIQDPRSMIINDSHRYSGNAHCTVTYDSFITVFLYFYNFSFFLFFLIIRFNMLRRQWEWKFGWTSEVQPRSVVVVVIMSGSDNEW